MTLSEHRGRGPEHKLLSQPLFCTWLSGRDCETFSHPHVHNANADGGRSPIPTRCILLNVIVPKLEYAGEVWEGNKKLAEKLETVQMSAAKTILLGCSTTTSKYSIESRVGDVRSQNKQRHEKTEMAT